MSRPLKADALRQHIRTALTSEAFNVVDDGHKGRQDSSYVKAIMAIDKPEKKRLELPRVAGMNCSERS